MYVGLFFVNVGLFDAFERGHFIRGKSRHNQIFV